MAAAPAMAESERAASTSSALHLKSAAAVVLASHWTLDASSAKQDQSEVGAGAGGLGAGIDLPAYVDDVQVAAHDTDTDTHAQATNQV